MNTDLVQARVHSRTLALQIDGSRYGDSLFPHVDLADGSSAHFYRWGQSPHAPVHPPPEPPLPKPTDLQGLLLTMPSQPQPPMLGLSDQPRPLRPLASKAYRPKAHVLPVANHICLGPTCSLFGSLPGQCFEFLVEEVEPPSISPEDMRRNSLNEGWYLEESFIFKQRKRWADSKSFFDGESMIMRMFETDWERCIMINIPKGRNAATDFLDHVTLPEVRPLFTRAFHSFV